MGENAELGKWKRGTVFRIWLAIGVIIVTPIVACLSAIEMARFATTGRSFLHPYLAMMFVFGCIALFAVAISSLAYNRKCLREVNTRVDGALDEGEDGEE